MIIFSSIVVFVYLKKVVLAVYVILTRGIPTPENGEDLLDGVSASLINALSSSRTALITSRSGIELESWNLTRYSGAISTEFLAKLVQRTADASQTLIVSLTASVASDTRVRFD